MAMSRLGGLAPAARSVGQPARLSRRAALPPRGIRATLIEVLVLQAAFSLWAAAAQAVVSRTSPPMNPPGGGGLPDPLLEAPEGYMAFVEAPHAEPPKVGPPPYVFVDVPCPGVAGPSGSKKTLNNLCGDLNKGVIPRNPMRPTASGTPYPFELIKNKTLEFFSKALPILQADESLPKVAKSAEGAYYSNPNNNRLVKRRSVREAPTTATSSARGARTAGKYCDNGGGVMCMLYKAIQGEPLGGALGALGLTGSSSSTSSSLRQGGHSAPNGGPERREDGGGPGPGPWPSHGGPSQGPPQGPPQGPQGAQGFGPHGGYEGPPPTPCPARVEYSTPVFARNYQGVWRYVVQIPYEGYFTQTVEVTRCLQNKCHYMDGACLSSPRWLSMLVAELYYPDAVLPGRDHHHHHHQHLHPNSAQQQPQHLLHKRSTRDATSRDFATSGDFAARDFAAGHLLSAGPVASNSTGRASSSSSSSSLAGGTPPGTHCDGVDEIGCFQVRLYYDWFLVPGSCKCWRPEYFSRFVRRKQASSDL